MKIRNVLVVFKDSILENRPGVVEKIKKILNKYNIKGISVKRSELGKIHTGNNYDLIIGFGGDGTLLRIARFAGKKLVLGVNMNPEASECALCSTVGNRLEGKIKRLAEGKFTIRKRTKARVFLERASQRFDALNEIYVGSAKSYQMSRYILRFGKVKEEQKSSGIIISTGTGSTAWYNSVGGKRFKPEAKKLKFIVKDPYKGKLLKFNLVRGEIGKSQKLRLKSEMENGIVAVDSITELPFGKEEQIEVSVSPETFKFVSFK